MFRTILTMKILRDFESFIICYLQEQITWNFKIFNCRCVKAIPFMPYPFKWNNKKKFRDPISKLYYSLSHYLTFCYVNDSTYLYACNALSLFICKKPSIELRQAIHRNDIAYKNHPKTKLRNIKKKINHNIETNCKHIPVQSIRIHHRYAISLETQNGDGRRNLLIIP